jgi:hypothetical protein
MRVIKILGLSVALGLFSFCSRPSADDEQADDQDHQPKLYDTTDLPDGYIVHKDSAECLEEHILYHPNGRLRERGCQGRVKSFGTPVGTWYNYDSNGTMEYSRTYVFTKDSSHVLIVQYLDSFKKVSKLNYDPHHGQGDTIWVRELRRSL